VSTIFIKWIFGLLAVMSVEGWCAVRVDEVFLASALHLFYPKLEILICAICFKSVASSAVSSLAVLRM